MKSQLLKSGEKIQGFKVIKAIEIPELQCVLQELTHEATGAQVLHIGNNDPENMFCLSFRTLPYNSNGIAHILEHTVLCGSQKFPIKDPFFAMTRRSLNTFMNALTGDDYTCYPAASQVTKDFYNLLEVYLDAVFKPLLNELSFLQEGHRLEFTEFGNPSSPLEYKGIVFNEMKGSLSSPTNRLSEIINENLFPNLSYGYNSGGDPKIIPTLSYHELCEFHKKHYHPSRCLFFFYGNLPLSKHLEFINAYALKDVQQKPPLPPLPLQPRFKQPVVKHAIYPISPNEDVVDKTLISISWLTCHILNQDDLLALNVLDIVLMDNDASPLKMALLKSGLCKQASSYLDDEMSEIPFTIVLKGCNPTNSEGIDEIIHQTLTHLVREGIPLHLIENAVHQLEFYRSEITGDQAPFGLSLFMRSALLKQHGGQAEDGLLIHSLFNRLHQRIIENPRYLLEKIQYYLLDNKHRVKIILAPDQELAKRELLEEKTSLEEIKSRLSEEQKKQLISQAAELAEFQRKQEEENMDVLPTVSLKDIPDQPRDYPLQKENRGPLEIWHHNTFTNSIVYTDLIFDLPKLSEEDLPYVRLFTVLSSQMGCASRDYKTNLEYMQENTGGIGTSLSLNLQAHDYSQFIPSIHIKGKAMHRKVHKLIPLMHEMTTSIQFSDIPRLKEVLIKHYSALESNLNQNALRYAINLSAQGLNIASKVANAWYGLDYFWTIKHLVQNLDSQINHLVNKLEMLQQQLFCLEGARFVLTCDQAMYHQIKDHAFYGLQEMKTKTFTPWQADYPLITPEAQGRIIASPVAFTGKVFNTVSYIHPDAAALCLASFLFDSLSLHTLVREQGGAYGGGASSNALAGNFYFYSYRDPNISKTLSAFEAAIHRISIGDFDEEDLEEAKLEMVQSLDAPVAPGSRGELAHSWLREGRTYAIRQAFRHHMLSLTCEDVIEVVKRHIEPQYAQGMTVSFASKELLEKENQLLHQNNQKTLEIKNI